MRFNSCLNLRLHTPVWLAIVFKFKKDNVNMFYIRCNVIDGILKLKTSIINLENDVNSVRHLI